MIINKENIDPLLLPTQLENFAELRAKAMEYIQQSAGATWTDHNLHDPGITILEAICYALGDVGFRMNFAKQDLLTDSEGNMAKNTHYLPAEILPCHAVTITDFRKLLLDLPTVKNAWLIPVLAENLAIKTDYEAMFVDEKGGNLLFEHEVNAKVGLTNAEKQAILNKKIFLQGLYALNIQFEPQLILGNIDTGESFEPVYEKDYFGDIYMDIANWKQLINNKLALVSIAKANLADINLVFNINPKNKFNNADGQLDTRVLSQWYFDIDITIKNIHAFKLKEVLFEAFFESKKGISGKDLKKILTQNNFQFFRNMFERIKLLAKAYIDIDTVLQQNRNLCEDFLPQISAIPTIEFRICADIDIDPKMDLEQIQAEIYLKIEQYLSPTPTFYTFAELQAKGYSTDQILEGPLLKNGFLLESEMGPNFYQTFNIYLSDIINAIYEIEGLVNIKNVQLNLIDDSGKNIPNLNPWEIIVPQGFQPVLSKRKSKFTFFKNQLPLLANFKESIVKYNILNINAIKQVNAEVPNTVPKGTYRELALHYTLADEFPATYHIGKNLPDEYLSDTKYFTSKQLEGYLLLFDQTIANFLTDLDQLKYTTSWSNISHINFNSASPSWRRDFLVDTNVNIKWQNVVESENNFLEKRNETLDFLLARFAENLEGIDNFFYLTIDNLGIDKAQYFKDLIKLKQEFLANYISISANRGAAINYKENSSYLATFPAGYEQRIARFLGADLIKNGKRKTVADVNSNAKTERGYFHCLEHILLRLPLLSTEMKKVLSNNGLQPELLSICTDTDCTACGGFDPYSFTASLAMPGWLPIYADVQYRDYMEQLIRRETPVGVMLRICWIDKKTMTAFEKALEEWWKARFSFLESVAFNFIQNFEVLVKKQNELIQVLKSFRSVYPPATLHGCEDESTEENNTRIFLGKTHLGEPKDFL
jgi:hypothetical protein